jgi:hypothetical protein
MGTERYRIGSWQYRVDHHLTAARCYQGKLI